MGEGVSESNRPVEASLRQRVLAALRAKDVKGLTIVPERSSVPGQREVNGVIVTDNGGHRFRLLETSDLVTLDEDTSPYDVCPTWLRVEAVPSPLDSVVETMLGVMKRV